MYNLGLVIGNKCTECEKREQIFFQLFRVSMQLFTEQVRLTIQTRINFIGYDTFIEYQQNLSQRSAFARFERHQPRYKKR